MTRNSDLDCEDLIGCDHEPETPIAEDGMIIGWLCRCGQRVQPKEVKGTYGKESDTGKTSTRSTR